MLLDSISSYQWLTKVTEVIGRCQHPWAVILPTVVGEVRPSLLSEGWEPQVLDLFRDAYILFFTCITIKYILLM